MIHAKRVLLTGCLATLVLTAASVADDLQLPVPCAAGCGPEVFVAQGNAVYTRDGTVGTITQLTDRVILNWESFNIAGENARVEFRQPRDISVALNRIYDQSPSQILGALDANGQVYLINPSGIIFGEESQVNTNTLLASTLNVGDAVFNGPGLIQAVLDNDPALIDDSDLRMLASVDEMGDIVVDKGAVLETGEGGRIYLFAPKIVNEGAIRTPGGQTILAASKGHGFFRVRFRSAGA